MADHSKLTLPGKFNAQKNYLIKGATLIAWRKALEADRIIAGQNLEYVGTPSGRILNARAGNPAPNGGPFCRVFRLEGKWMLTGGTVTGGDGNVPLDDIELGTIGSEPADGTWVWIEASGEAITEDEVLLPGIDVSTATVASGTTFPASNTIPTADAPTGVLHISLGSWSGGKFIPAACGNIHITHCPGTLSHIRQ